LAHVDSAQQEVGFCVSRVLPDGTLEQLLGGVKVSGFLVFADLPR
jgi:putative aminopeptidase FrvX